MTGVARSGDRATTEGYSAADSASLQSGFWQSTVSPGPPGPPAGPQSRVHALFNLDVKTEAPFPTNWFTVPDRSNLTNRRVHLPLPDCKVFVSDCEDLNVINELDGFNLQPRLSIPFDGPIDVKSVTSQNVFLINLGDTVDGREHGDHVVGINQIVWDPDTNALHVESDQLLDQHTRYALIVTNSIQDANGNPIQASEAFRNFRHEVRGEYKHELLEAIHAARRFGIREQDIVDASVFTTESATAILEKIRDQIHASTPDPADFNLGPDGMRTVFPLDQVTGITFNEQTGARPTRWIGSRTVRATHFCLASPLPLLSTANNPTALPGWEVAFSARSSACGRTIPTPIRSTACIPALFSSALPMARSAL
jgi:hypothetical protein